MKTVNIWTSSRDTFIDVRRYVVIFDTTVIICILKMLLKYVTGFLVQSLS